MTFDDVSRYVVRDPQSGRWRYYRRVPRELAELDSRIHVKQSLKTRNHREALQRAEEVHRATEALWRALAAGADKGASLARYDAAVKLAQSYGFTYSPVEQVARLDLDEIERRLEIAAANLDKPIVVEAMTGTAPAPRPTLSMLWELYEEHNAASFRGMSKDQKRKHKISRERAITYAVASIGDKALADITRADVLSFRRWWVSKMEAESLRAYSVNRSFSDIKGMLTIVDDALQTKFGEAWEKIRIKETNATRLGKRPMFPIEWVQDRILATGAMDAMNEDARLIVYAMAETGCRPGEICNLRPEDIRLGADVPHIEIAERDDRRQKTAYSVRRIPLVGVSLWAMRQRPKGFARYADKGDSASALINKVLKSQGLLPSDKHVLYSMRHTFQFRLEKANASDRMQADLMGHELGRPTYGDGPEMVRRKEMLEGIAFRWPSR
ncbi:site-specific integrase [Pararhizobium gei]|uniref:site-specific integrase n=1 Tax=Pararhizobium gei TaxID=1395951 RepID=UPI0023DB5C0E|nr:site-specific integrase [Rhizobium gei]